MARENKLELSYKITILLWYFASGAEMVSYQPILPEFLDSLGISQAHLGTLVSMFGLASMIASPVFGKIADKMGQILTANSFSIMGHLIIINRRNLFSLCIAKILIGIGMSCDGCILGQVGRQISKSSRSRQFSKFFAMRQVGLIGFPICFFATGLYNWTGSFEIFGRKIDRFSIPSVIMLIIWFQVLGCNFIFYTKQEIVKFDDNNDDNLLSQTSNLLERKFKALKDNLLHELVIIGILGSVSAATTVVTMEAVIGPITNRYLNWGATDLAALHIICGISSISGYVLIKPLLRCSNQAQLMAIAACSIILAVLVLSSILSVATTNRALVTFLFRLGAVIFSFFIPHLYVLGAALVSRNCHPDNQAVIQGVRIGLGNTMLAIGPLWAGHTMQLAISTNYFQIIFIWIILFLSTFLCFLLFSKKILRIDRKTT